MQENLQSSQYNANDFCSHYSYQVKFQYSWLANGLTLSSNLELFSFSSLTTLLV